jgi:hypothetical protein
VKITQAEARPGDVLVDSGQTFWERGQEEFQWATFTGPYGYFGEWDPATMGPQGKCTLLWRAGKRAGRWLRRMKPPASPKAS